MLSLVIIHIIFFVLIFKTENRVRVWTVISLYLIYGVFIIVEQFYLKSYYNWSFNTSDPVKYFMYMTRETSIPEMLEIVEREKFSNSFYFIVNLFFYKNFYFPDIYGPLLKLQNLVCLFIAYLLVVRKETKINKFDLILLLHPWLIMTLIRNVRDFYIIFAVSIFLHFFIKKRFLHDYFFFLVACVIIYFARPVFLIIPIIYLFFNFAKNMDKTLKRLYIYGSSIILILITVIFRVKIIGKIVSQFISALQQYHGQDEALSELARSVAISGGVSFSFLITIFLEMLSAIPLFLFSPHPAWVVRYLENRSEDGIFGIYTDFDNWLIVFGGLFTYIFIIPLIFKFFHKFNKMSFELRTIPLIIFVLYVFFYLGRTDIRNHYAFMFFLLIPFIKGELNFSFVNKRDYKYLFLSLIIFIGLGIKFIA